MEFTIVDIYAYKKTRIYNRNSIYTYIKLLLLYNK